MEKGPWPFGGRADYRLRDRAPMVDDRQIDDGLRNRFHMQAHLLSSFRDLSENDARGPSAVYASGSLVRWNRERLCTLTL